MLRSQLRALQMLNIHGYASYHPIYPESGFPTLLVLVLFWVMCKLGKPKRDQQERLFSLTYAYQTYLA